MTWYGIVSIILIAIIIVTLISLFISCTNVGDNIKRGLSISIGGLLIVGLALLILLLCFAPDPLRYSNDTYDLERFAEDLEAQGCTVERITKTISNTQMKKVADYIYRDDNWFTGPTNTWRYIHYEPKNVPADMEQYRR